MNPDRTTVKQKCEKFWTLPYSFVRGRWTDAGTFESLNEANELFLRNDNKIEL